MLDAHPASFTAVATNSLVMAFDPEPQDAQAFHRAAERTEIAGRLFEGDTRFEGYGWYDALARVRNLTTNIIEGGVTHSLDALRAAPGFPHTLSRPDAIHVHLHFLRGNGPPETMTVPADLAFVGEGWTWVAEARPLVTRDSDLKPEHLKQLLRASYFSPSDDADADSYTTQKDRFLEEAMHIAVTLLASEDEARKHTIAEAVWREILWVAPRDREVSIKVSQGRVSVEFGPESPAPAEAAA